MPGISEQDGNNVFELNSEEKTDKNNDREFKSHIHRIERDPIVPRYYDKKTRKFVEMSPEDIKAKKNSDNNLTNIKTESLPTVKDNEFDMGEVTELKLGGYIDSSEVIEVEVVEENSINPMDHIANMQNEHDEYNNPQSAWERLENNYGKIDIAILRNLFIKALNTNEESKGLGKYLEFHDKLKLTEVASIICDKNGIFKNSDEILIEVENNPKIAQALENLNSDNPSKNDVKLEHDDFILFSYIGMAKTLEGENIYNWIDNTLHGKDRQPKIGFIKRLGGKFRSIASGVKHKAIDISIGAKNKMLSLPKSEEDKKKEKANKDLFDAVISRDVNSAKKAIKAGANVNNSFTYHLGESHLKATFLYWALRYSSPNIVKLLIENKADVNHIDDMGNSPFILACKMPDIDIEIIEKMIEYGGDCNKPDADGNTAIDYVKDLNQPEKVKLIEDAVEKGKEQKYDEFSKLMIMTNNFVSGKELEEGIFSDSEKKDKEQDEHIKTMARLSRLFLGEATEEDLKIVRGEEVKKSKISKKPPTRRAMVKNKILARKVRQR